MLLPETDARGAAAVAAQLIQAVDALARPHAASPVAPVVSVSVGVSSHGGGPLAPDEATVQPAPMLERLVAAADEALYAAKKGGRRRACSLALADQGHPERAVPTLALVAAVPSVESRRA